MIIRVRHPEGTLRLTTQSDWTITTLRSEIANLTSIPPHQQKLLVGYPNPRDMDEVCNGNEARLLQDVLVNGDLVIVEKDLSRSIRQQDQPKAETSVPAQSIAAQANSIATEAVDKQIAHALAAVMQSSNVAQSPVSSAYQGRFERVRVPDDNSCLFRSVINVLGGPDKAPIGEVIELRHLVAQVVDGQKELYNEVLLGKPNNEYQQWIQQDASWGGAIELSIFSQIFQVEFAAVDIKSLRVDRYGEDQGYQQRGFLIYDGIHYDSLAMNMNAQPLQQFAERTQRTTVQGLETLFPTSDPTVLEKAISLAHEYNIRRDYTDTASFELRCADCGYRMKGEKEAVEHAKNTGHSNFREG